jgi:chromosome partitioning protein
LTKSANPLPRIPATGLVGGGKASAKMSATVAVYSVKGGVGKTSLAANLAWCSARLSGHRTLLWDLDAAGGAGFLLGVEPGESKLAHDVISRGSSADKLISATACENLDVLPADESLRGLDSQFARIGKRKRLARLAEDLSGTYQRIVLDCPPVMNEISAQVVRAADVVIVPLPPSPLSSRALSLVAKEIAAHGKRRPPILPVFSMLDLRRTLHREARAAHPDWPAVPYSSAVEQCAVRQQPVGAFAASSPAAKAFADLWAAIEKKLESMPLD